MLGVHSSAKVRLQNVRLKAASTSNSRSHMLAEGPSRECVEKTDRHSNNVTNKGEMGLSTEKEW